jgi:hypothetical protein
MGRLQKYIRPWLVIDDTKTSSKRGYREGETQVQECYTSGHWRERRTYMPGEVIAEGWFDISELEAVELEAATGEEIVSPIIDWGTEFFLRATFGGGGCIWENMTRNGFGYVVTFHAEHMGPDVDDMNLGEVTGNLVNGQSDYQVDSPTNNMMADGIWKCGVAVTFRTPDGIGHWSGVFGYKEDCLIQITRFEMPQ